MTMNGHVVIVHKSELSYLAHAGLVQRARSAVSTAGNAVKNAGSRARQNVKYFARELRPNGKYDYWYSLQEYRAHLQAQAKKSQQTAKAVADKAIQTVQNTASAAKKAGQNAANTAKDKLGVDERERAVSATQKLNEEWNKSGNNRTEAFDKAAEESAKAVSEYRKTPLGKAESALNTATRPARVAAAKVQNMADNVQGAVTFRDKDGNEISGKEAAKQVGNAAISGLKSKGQRMRDEFKKNVSDTAEKAENAAKKAVGTVKETADKAAETVKETGEKAVSSAKETAEKVADKAKETAEKTSEAVKDTAKEVSDQAKETAAKVSDKISEVADKIRKSNEPPKAELSPEGEEHVIEETVLPEKMIKEKEISEQKIEENKIDENRLQSATEAAQSKGKIGPKSEYGEYNEKDPDFADANYDKAERIGDTDFLTFKRDDGTSVILEEDMKWVLPKGVDANDPAIRKAIQGFADEVESARSIGKDDYSFEEWRDAVTEAIDEAAKKNLK